MTAEYFTVRIPRKLADRLDALKEPEGYHSRAEIVNDAIRRFLEGKKRTRK